MHVTVNTNNRDAFKVIKDYCVNNNVMYDTLSFGQENVLSIKNPNNEVIRAISRCVKALSPMVQIYATVYVDKVQKPINIDDLDI